ncbi:hypothetical protein IMSHALPRED_009426 [Imshaugia aleurites]|uniref:Uncharacterized protein n=1 Tax=Imshaugia aleurites TaxID=172621 RepID=A0A8H3G5Q8_9LECA|nr:hypothetical protein IMSHALPRED_009426 [Imshaugia aleurites]
MNILTDVCLIGLPWTIVTLLKAANSKQFTLTLVLNGSSVCHHSACLPDRTQPSGDLTFGTWPVTLGTQIPGYRLQHVGDPRRQRVPGFDYKPEEGSKSAKEAKSGRSFSSLESKLSMARPRDEDVELQDNAGAVLQNLGDNVASDAERHK